MVTVSRLQKTLAGGHLDTSKHNYSCIMAIAGKALHQSKQNLGSGCYNIDTGSSILHESYFVATPISSHVLCT